MVNLSLPLLLFYVARIKISWIIFNFDMKKEQISLHEILYGTVYLASE